MIRRNKPEKRQLPTVEEFLRFRPKRIQADWTTNSEGLVEIKIPKFKSNLGSSFCRIVKKENEFTVNMDKFGTIVWKNADGNKTVKDILEILQKNFPKEENMDQRLFLFLQQLNNLGYIEL